MPHRPLFLSPKPGGHIYLFFPSTRFSLLPVPPPPVISSPNPHSSPDPFSARIFQRLERIREAGPRRPQLRPNLAASPFHSLPVEVTRAPVHVLLSPAYREAQLHSGGRRVGTAARPRVQPACRSRAAGGLAPLSGRTSALGRPATSRAPCSARALCPWSRSPSARWAVTRRGSAPLNQPRTRSANPGWAASPLPGMNTLVPKSLWTEVARSAAFVRLNPLLSCHPCSSYI